MVAKGMTGHNTDNHYCEASDDHDNKSTKTDELTSKRCLTSSLINNLLSIN